MKINDFLVTLRNFAAEAAGFIGAGKLVSQFTSNWFYIALGQGIGWITAKQINEFADKEQRERGRPPSKPVPTGSDISYRSDHAKQLVKSNESSIGQIR